MENKTFKATKKLGEFKTFGEYIKDARWEYKMSRKDLADKIYNLKEITVKEKTIKLWERDAEYPDLAMIYILAEVLQIHPNDLLLAKQYMCEAGLNAIDMVTIRLVCNFIDVSIWKIHCFISIVRWDIPIVMLCVLLPHIWWMWVLALIILVFAILAAVFEIDFTEN